MKKYILPLLLLVVYTSHSQPTYNAALKHQLDSIMVQDQLYRDTLTQLMDPQKADSTAKSFGYKSMREANNHYWPLQNRIDSLNLALIEKIIAEYGYPGKTLVDTPANETVWYVIQHSKEIHKYIDVMKRAADNGELPFHLYAMMLDRDLMNQNKEQAYGTQVNCRNMKNGQYACFVWPIANPATVNLRRKKAGFNSTVEENAQRLDVVYRVVTMSEVQ